MSTAWKTGLLICLAATLTACGGGGGGGSSASKPRVRFVNASVDSTALTFKLNGDTEATGVLYPGISSAFKNKDQNSYDIAVREDGGTEDLDASIATFVNEKEYLVSAVGLESFGSEPQKRLRLVAPEIDLTAPNGNKARIYVLHAFVRATGFDTPNIDLRNPGDNPQYKVENIAFSSIGTLLIDASTQTFVARRTGTESVYATQTFTFDPSGVYVGIVSGIEGEVGASAPKIQFIKLN